MATKQKRVREVEKKYLKVMEEMYILGEFNGNEITGRNNASKAIPTALKNLGYIKSGKIRGVWKWVGDYPKIEDVEKVRTYLAEEVSRRRSRKNKHSERENHTITEEQALQVLRNSEKYTYEIYRVETKISRQKLF